MRVQSTVQDSKKAAEQNDMDRSCGQGKDHRHRQSESKDPVWGGVESMYKRDFIGAVHDPRPNLEAHKRGTTQVTPTTGTVEG